ncbi:MAG: 30S ribosomal protein S12 methylthiotransferase RimO [Chlorobi bacterium]|nr:30S ribosomal protein S12 methylthiotransferase RimO [Chlorobiota bacterium]
MKKKNKIELISLGCSKNTVDGERLMKQLELNDFEFVDNSKDAESVIINTCGFIEPAKEESVNTILEAVALKKKGEIKKVIVAGCLSERYMEDLKKEIPEVDAFYGAEQYEEIVRGLGGNLKKNLLGERVLTTPNHYAYLKISEGCDNPCSFCAIPLIRGKYRSFNEERLIGEAAALAKEGVKELILIGQDTTDFGKDFYGKRTLAAFMNRLTEIDGIEWVRLLYAYPSHFPQNIIDQIASNPKICSYIDLPLQHISDDVLKSMRRGISKRKTIELIDKLKSGIPNLTLRTTFIVGYPNETEKDFDELYNFIKETEFDRVGIFDYSREEDTTGYPLGDSVPAEEKERRKAVLMELQREISAKKNETFVGKKMKTIIDRLEGDYFVGRTERDAPEVDGEVLVEKDVRISKGNFYDVEIVDFNDYDLFGRLS